MTPRIDLAPRPPRDALTFFRAKGYAPEQSRFHYLDVFRAEHAKAFVVAKAMRNDVLTTIRSAVDSAIAEGRTLEQFKAELRPELERLGWWGKGSMIDPATGQWTTVQLGSDRRLRVIFDANIRAAHAAGRWARIQRSKRAFPYLRYRQIQRATRRDEHAPYHDIILPVDHPAWRRIFPPNGWFCGCTVLQVSRRDLEREGLSVSEDFVLEDQPFVNKRTGETVRVPRGIGVPTPASTGSTPNAPSGSFHRTGPAPSPQRNAALQTVCASSVSVRISRSSCCSIWTAPRRWAGRAAMPGRSGSRPSSSRPFRTRRAGWWPSTITPPRPG